MPCAIFIVLFLGLRHCRNIDIEKIQGSLSEDIGKRYGFRLYIPIVLLVALLVVSKVFPSFPQLGTCFIFLISAVVACFTGKRFNPLEKAISSMETTIPVMAKLMGVGMFIQVMTLVGARGWIVVSSLALGLGFVYFASCTVMPAFGAVSSYGAASVMGVPFLLVIIQRGGSCDIVVAAALSFLCCLGDIMPPTALAGNYAAQIVGLKYGKVLKKSLIPFLFCVMVGLMVMLNSSSLAFLAR